MPLFDEAIARLQTREPLPPLTPRHAWSAELSEQITSASDDELFGEESKNLTPDQKAVCRAGLLVWNDDIDTAHDIVQNVGNSTGSFWHAIIHREEGDTGNSYYWWRRTGDHPAFSALYEAAQELLENETDAKAKEFATDLKAQGCWQPMGFVACCDFARQGRSASGWLQRLQVAEFQTLLNWCRHNPI